MRDSATLPVTIASFVRELRFDALPADVVACGAALPARPRGRGGRRRRARRVAASARDAAVAHMGGGAMSARLLFDGRKAGLAGAAFAGAATIDAFDAHDGHVLTKGHAGAAVLPALLAFTDGRSCGSREFLTCIVLGYEVATRAGIALHASVAGFPLLGRVERAGLRRASARACSRSTTRSSVMRWVSPNIGARAGRSCGFANRRRC